MKTGAWLVVFRGFGVEEERRAPSMVRGASLAACACVGAGGADGGSADGGGGLGVGDTLRAAAAESGAAAASR